MEVTIDLRQYENLKIKEHIVVSHSDLKAVNTESNPDNITPYAFDKDTIDNSIVKAILPKQSWNVIRFTYE